MDVNEETTTSETKDNVNGGNNAIKNFCVGFTNYFKNLWTRIKSIGPAFKTFAKDDKKTKLRKIGRFVINYALILFIIVYVVIVAVINPNFVNLRNIVNILDESSLLLMVSLGMAGIIVLTGADLSASSIMYFVVVFVVCLLPNITLQDLGSGKGVYLIENFTLPLVVAFVVALIVGGLIGGINGTLVAKFKVHPFIGTMATNFVFGASALTLLLLTVLGGQGTTVQIEQSSPIIDLVRGGFKIGDITVPNIIWFAIIASIVMALIWNKTKFGKNMFAVGCNPEAARVAGVNVKFVTTMVFVMGGVMYGYAAFFGIGKNSGGAANSYDLYGLYAIAACVIGGVSFTGGVGKIRGVVFGVILFQLIRNSTYYTGLTNAVGNVFIGIIVGFAVVFDMLKYKIRA